MELRYAKERTSGLFAIFVTHSDTSAMSYVLKDHIGSLYATVTDGDVEYYSFDAWGRERNHSTLEYDNVAATTFDRGFCMHEYYRDFGLINMNGRMYDPLVGRILSPDIVIQNPEYSQSYNRYTYCFNNPLRFTDPSGYVVRGRNDVLNPQYFIWLKSSNSKNGNSFNTDIVEGSPMMMEDNYTVDEQGYIKLVEKTNDDFDILYTKASWDSGEKDDFIKLDKGILDNQYFQCVKNPYDNIEYKYHILKVRGDNLARNIFEFVSSHSNVEWSRSLVGVDGIMGLNYITTTHLVGTEYGGFHLYVTQLKSYTYRGNDHSHDNNTNTISESDLKFAEMIQKQHSNAKFNIYTPLDGIYTPFDKNSIPGLLPEIIIKP